VQSSRLVARSFSFPETGSKRIHEEAARTVEQKFIEESICRKRIARCPADADNAGDMVLCPRENQTSGIDTQF